MLRKLATIAPLCAFAIALIATLGSLYAQYLGIEPCVLCWWQRVFMYPLVVIILIGIWYSDLKLSAYVLPLSILGGLTAFYQTLLYYGILPKAFAPCSVGVSCTELLPSLLGLNLITASLISFVVISALMIIHRRFNHEIN